MEMEEVMIQSNIMAMDKASNVVLDIESQKQPPDKRCSGSKSLARKGSYRMDKQETEEPSKNLFIKEINILSLFYDNGKQQHLAVLPPQLDQLKPPLVQSKALITVPSVLNSPISADSGDGRNKRFQRWTTIHPRKILLFFATIGTRTSIHLAVAKLGPDGLRK
ncbi:hypothetical protein IEQ34_010364 [Dendrobium chrysotoxum]|uniref:Uncharacterized protein n=1 Tax=Dendrobium chrysotoxum TaxID=161865 RepID=A0AAV7H413_DENCH|nr:hypothetical protein IEQ34_010364 [Dendrobium chrysotoxum]